MKSRGKMEVVVISRMQGRLRRFKGRLMERWGECSGNNRAVTAGQREQLVGHLQAALEIDSRTARQEAQGLQPLGLRLTKSCLRCML